MYNGAERAGEVVGQNGAGEDISGVVYMMMNSDTNSDAKMQIHPRTFGAGLKKW